MGIQVQQLNFLRYCHSKQPFGDVVTLGRQALMIPKLNRKFGQFCEAFLQAEFGAGLVDSYDYCAMEGATQIANLNLPISNHRQYQTVIDFGTLEHLFDIAQALRNASALCAIGGQIIHCSPANNFCGHGFWQFSPELFMSLYSERNGYRDTEVFLSDREKYWFKVKAPQNGRRAEIVSARPLDVLCRTVKSQVAAMDVQQSDYVYLWNRKRPEDGKLKAFIRSRPILYRAAVRTVGTVERVRRSYSIGLNRRNPHLQKLRVGSLIS